MPKDITRRIKSKSLRPLPYEPINVRLVDEGPIVESAIVASLKEENSTDASLENASLENARLENASLEDLNAIIINVNATHQDQTSISNDLVREPTIREPTVREPTIREPTVREPTIREPTVREPTIREPAIMEPAIMKPVLNHHNLTRQANIVGLIKRGMAYISSKVLNLFSSLPKKNEIAIIFVANHGGYHINNKLGIKIIECPIKKLIRLQYSPYGTCSWSSNIDRINNYVNLHNTFNNRLTSSTSDSLEISKTHNEHVLIVPQNPTGYTSIKDKHLILEKLSLIGEQNKGTDVIVEDFYTKTKTKPNKFGESKINLNAKKSNKVLENSLGDKLYDKLYDVSNDGELRGISVLFNVTFKLPDICFTPENELKLTQLLQNAPPSYLIGRYNTTTSEITYIANTELLSCPFFKMFAEIDDPIQHNIIDAYSIFDDKNKPILRPMINTISTETIYRYFQYVDMFVNIDYSCSSFSFEDKIEHRLHKMGKKRGTKILTRFRKNIEKNNLRGGLKTRKQHSKRRINTKRRIK
jgi:hypothetical protein